MLSLCMSSLLRHELYELQQARVHISLFVQVTSFYLCKYQKYTPFISLSRGVQSVGGAGG